jgi:serine/threonine protein kinase
VAGYLLADLVGVGGMAVVFRARDGGLGRTVARKVLAGNLAGDQAAELRRAPDGTWSVIDLDSDNGIQANGKDVPSGTAVPVHLGDQIHLGAWTLITLISAIA